MDVKDRWLIFLFTEILLRFFSVLELLPSKFARDILIIDTSLFKNQH